MNRLGSTQRGLRVRLIGDVSKLNAFQLWVLGVVAEFYLWQEHHACKYGWLGRSHLLAVVHVIKFLAYEFGQWLRAPAHFIL